MTTELCVSLAELSRLERGVPHNGTTLMCRVVTAHPPRQREFNSGRVFNVSGRLLDSGHGDQGEVLVNVYFYDEWASAAAFVEEDDIMSVKGFIVHDTPQVGNQLIEFPFFVTIAPQSATLRVLQKGIKDDIMEVTVVADALDAPAIRVLPKKLWSPFVTNDVCRPPECRAAHS
ncbi:hypothetical protein TRVL_09048 [Trypanosoma vivax]|uniref:Uncharacterized protein n=1 Tax=Trypanosoma vivax (strain Y486) TaxID=1055687 RepID=G0UD25_TRYVY|nr:hypothetical protein TRVL_09048 [Trypanosoma vivax]CCC53735.1 conserved hypothetical protein [Trypanosoma vivax Y486]